MLLPLQGNSFASVITQVLPWARSFCPFRAFRCNLWMSLVLLQKLLYCYQ